ncbi:MAG: glycosyltransferase family 39 protein [Anaerolineales bacterium]|nr:glycosyltransferase family 39 protein [Anaerolineales bacterium]MCB9145961.1 glycosyltransferase family 39 protein [Anaerolineales bacterium]
MQSIKSFINNSWEKLLVLIGVLGVLLPASPLNMPLTFRDPGVFLYIGWRILNGELPYRDVWDHKPPVIFYINALGLALGGGSRWGVWVLELAFLFIAAWLGYQLIKKYFGTFPAVFSLLLWMLSLVGVLQGGNYTTELTLPMQFAALWLLVFPAQIKDRTRFLTIGALGALAFFTKQTTIGMWAAIVLYLTAKHFSARTFNVWVREILSIGAGALAVTVFIIGFFFVQGAFPQFWSAVFEYNFVYAGRGGADLAQRFDSLLRGLRPLTFTGLTQFGLLGFTLALIFTLTKRFLPKESIPLLTVVLIDLPIELYLASITTKTFFHYYMTLLPAFAVLASVVVWSVVKVISRWQLPAWVRAASALLVLSGFAWSYFDNYLDQTYIYRKNRDDAAIVFIQKMTNEGDTVLVWGAETSVNFFAQRKSPTRFVYQYPLQNEDYATEAMVLEFLNDVLNTPPRLVIDTGTDTPLFTFPISSDEISQKSEALRAQYCPFHEIDTWTVYKACSP